MKKLCTCCDRCGVVLNEFEIRHHNGGEYCGECYGCIVPSQLLSDEYAPREGNYYERTKKQNKG